MVVKSEYLVSYVDWLAAALPDFFLTIALLLLVGFFVCYALTVIRHGPLEALRIVVRVTAIAVTVDLPRTSPTRIWAIARLVILESLRRRVLLAVFILISVIYLFGGWFLTEDVDNPTVLYASFVMDATVLLIIIMAVLLSSFSLPNDIRSRTIYTVMTKPVRPQEIFLGRVLGFATVSTVLLAFMWLVSFTFVVRGLRHSHTVDALSVEKDDEDVYRGTTTEASTQSHAHQHDIEIGKDGKGRTDRKKGHRHAVTMSGELANAEYEIGPPQGHLQARVPVYGSLKFRDRFGRPSSRGISVGKMWTYRTYIEGDSLNTAIWTFENVTKERYPNGVLPIEMNLRVFRTFKGDIVSGIRGALRFRSINPHSEIQETREIPFTAVEYATMRMDIRLDELKLLDAAGNIRPQHDFFDDLVGEDRAVEIWIRCEEHGQYFGMAQGDVYLRVSDASFFWNFTKAYIGIWLLTLLVISFGVLLSSFLSGPVTLVALGTTYFFDLYRERILGLADTSIEKGPIESFIRIVTQTGEMVELDQGLFATQIMQAMDKGFLWSMRQMLGLLPDYKAFNTGNFVAQGFNIFGDLVAKHGTITLSYCFLVAIIGYFVLKTREIAA